MHLGVFQDIARFAPSVVYGTSPEITIPIGMGTVGHLGVYNHFFFLNKTQG